MSICRPLRWLKFVVLGFLLLVATVKGRPVFSLLAALSQHPWVESPQPLALPLLASVGCLLGWGALLLDVVLDRHLPKSGIVGIVALAVAPWSPSPVPPGLGDAQVRRIAREVQREAQEALRTTGALPTSPWPLLEGAPGPYRSRNLWRPPLRLRILQGAEGPIRARLGDDVPGTVYLAVRQDGSVGWITWLVASEGRVHASRQGGQVEILAVVATPASKRSPLAGGFR